MISDSSNTDPDNAGHDNASHDNVAREVTEQVVGPRPKPARRVAWEYDGDPKTKVKLAPTALGLVWSGIVLAAACYPIVVGTGLTVWLTLLFGLVPVSLEGILSLAFFLFIGFVVGLIYGIIMSVPAYFLTQSLSWSLQGVISERGASGIYGGMTGFLCVSGGGLFFVDAVPYLGGWNEWLPQLLVLMLAVVMGHSGAILVGYRKRKAGFPFFMPIFSFEKQVTISYLMKLTFLIAAVSVILKAAGPAGLCIGIAWLLYAITQALLLGCDHWLTRRLNRSQELDPQGNVAD